MPFCTKNHLFTKTGSGQTSGKHSRQRRVFLRRYLLEISNGHQRRVLLDLSRHDMLWDVFIATQNNATIRSGVEDETRCGADKTPFWRAMFAQNPISLPRQARGS